MRTEYLRRKWREDVTDPRTGFGQEALKAEAGRLVAELKGREPWPIVKARLFEMVCSRMSIGVSAEDFFPAFAVWSRRDRVLTKIINDRMAEIDATVCADAMKRAREMPLAALGEAMAADWREHETLRLRMLASRRKWGNNEPFTNALMREIFATFGAHVNGRPNSRGGRFFASGHSIDFFQILGKWTAATPDGRRKGEEFSKNISPAPGADRAGATALIGSVRAIDSRDIPGDVILDVTLHPSSVAGEKGLVALRALVEEYFAAGGCSIHFNVFSAEELRDAQAHPERYENLQVRVCGWNVRWNDLDRRNQDAYIRRCEGVSE